MKKLMFVLIAAVGMSCSSYAQMTEKEVKKATKEAQKLVKDARNEFDRDDIPNKSHAKSLIDQAMKNQYVKDWDQTWFEAARIYNYYFDQENLKSYNGRYDTVAMYKYLTDWFDFALKADSLQKIPNAKGKTSDEAHTKLAPEMHRNLTNLITGGIFYFNDRTDYKKAYALFDRYFTMAEGDFLKSYMENDTYYPQTKALYAYYTTMAAYNQSQWENTIKYAQIAQQDEEYGESATEFLCDAYGNMCDTVKWIEALKAGLIKYPTQDYYYSKLLSYYDRKNDMAALENFTKEMIALDPDKAYNYFVLGLIAQQNKEYDKAIEQYEIAIQKDEKLSDAYNNLALSIMYQATEYVDSKSNVDYRSAEFKKVMAQEKEYYKKALPYVEKFREVDPEAVSKWGLLLQQIYYKLNMDKELKEIDKLLGN
jgi:hypothetical protein